MIGKLIDAAANNRALVLLGAIVLAGFSYRAISNIDLDAIPDLSDPQVIVFTEWMGRSPTLVEDQVTYPLVTALLSVPHVDDVRGQTMFGMSFVYVVFEEGTDIYWARSRVLEYLSTIQGRLPAGVTPRIGPDATGIGWVYQYVVTDKTGRHDLGELRTLQDYTIRYALSSVKGVAEVATVGGFQPQYQVTVDPNRLRSYGLTMADVGAAIRRSNADVGGRVLEMSGREYFIRGRGYIGGVDDIERVVVRMGEGGTPVLVRDVGSVRMGSEIRRGAADLDGTGEAVSGIVVMRYGENALAVIRRVEAKLDELRPSLPEGVEIGVVYDRADLIHRAIDTLRHALTEEMIVVALVIILFLLHLRSAALPIISLPLSVAAAFIPMYLFDIPATIMSLGGIAIAIGATVDAEIVMVEAAHKKLEHAPANMTEAERKHLLAEAAKEVTPAIFFSLLIIAASFIPVFGLTGQAGRLFRPLAFTKTFVMLSAALLSVTVAPALRDFLIKGKIRSEANHPVSRVIRAVYEPFVYVALRRPITTVLIGLFALVSALPVARRLGSEFMPPLDEGDILYMPTTLPNISIEEARLALQRQDAILRAFPEVLTVLGKVGRADSPTDPAPLSMVETMVRLRPSDQWRRHHLDRWWSGWTPGFLGPALRWLWPDEVPITHAELVRQMNEALQMPGFVNAFTQPIRNRVDMITTGIRTPIGIKIYGADLDAIEAAGTELERVLRGLPGTRSVFFERQTGGAYIDVVPDRDALARYGLEIGDVQDIVETALGGLPITTTVEGRNRFTVNVRYAEDFRSSLERIREVLVPLPRAGAMAESGAQTGDGAMGGGDGAASTGAAEAEHIPLGTVADVRITTGPAMIRDEAGMLVGYVYVDITGDRDIGSYVDEARLAVARATEAHELRLPPGSYLRWTGQYELLADMETRMKILIPVALLIVVVLLFFEFKNFTEVLIVLLSVPFALVGSVWALWLLGFNLSTAVWVGVIALVGLAAQTGVVMIVYIDHAYERRHKAGQINSLEDIIHAHSEGTIQRVRPKLMTVGTMMIGLTPLLWADGSGADVMRRIAAPMVGGLVTSAFLTLEIIPVIYTYWRYEQLLWRWAAELAPAHLPPLQWLKRAIAIGFAAAAAALVAPLYVEHSPAALLTVAAVSASLAVATAVAYAVLRARMKHAIDRVRREPAPA
jgi:copper/silver efflux system protein